MQNKVAVVTGGARGIGYATASLLACRGAEVVVADVIPCAGEQRFHEIPADVTSPEAVRNLFRTVRERFGRLDILVMSAGRPYNVPSTGASDEVWQECLTLNLTSAWYCAREAQPMLDASGHGSIVAVSSIQALFGGRGSSLYSAAKAGLLGMIRSLAVEYAPNIRVNAVVPAQVESVRTKEYFGVFEDPELAYRQTLAMYPMHRLGKPEDVASAVAFLASEEASWITGVALPVDGGRSASVQKLADLAGGGFVRLRAQPGK